jgi:hypothetical protein
METLQATRPAAGLGFARAVIGIAGVVHLSASILLLLAPYSYFMLLEHYPPYNRHYTGDLGAFQLPLGIGLLVAASQPFRYRMVVLIAAAANLLQALNHIYDGLISPTTLVYWIADVGPLLLMAVVLMIAYARSDQPD